MLACGLEAESDGGSDSTFPPVLCSVHADTIIKEREPKARQCSRFIRICVAAQRQNVG